MISSRVVYGAMAALAALMIAAPAQADEWHGRGWHHGHWDRPWWGPGYYYGPPRVYYAPPPVVYAPPPPVYYAPPGVSFGMTIR